MKKSAYFLLGFLIPFILVALTHADSIILKNGKAIQTQGTWEENGYVKFFKDGKIHSGFPGARWNESKHPAENRKFPQPWNNLLKIMAKSR